MVRSLPEGPSQAERIGHRGTIWAEAIDGSGRSSKASLSMPDPYDFTANSALDIASRIQFASGLRWDWLLRPRHSARILC